MARQQDSKAIKAILLLGLAVGCREPMAENKGGDGHKDFVRGGAAVQPGQPNAMKFDGVDGESIRGGSRQGTAAPPRAKGAEPPRGAPRKP